MPQAVSVTVERAACSTSPAPTQATPLAAKVAEGVAQSHRPVVENVIVGKRHAAHAELLEHFRRDWRGAEEERLRIAWEPLTAIGNGTLEVDDEEIGGVRQRDDLGCEQLGCR